MVEHKITYTEYCSVSSHCFQDDGSAQAMDLVIGSLAPVCSANGSCLDVKGQSQWVLLEMISLEIGMVGNSAGWCSGTAAHFPRRGPGFKSSPRQAVQATKL